MKSEGLALVFVIMVGAALIGYALHLRYKRRELHHKERLAALEKGFAAPAMLESAEPPVTPWSSRLYLLRGLIWLFSGAGLAAFLLGVGLATSGPERLEERLWRAHRAKELGATEEQLKEVVAPRVPVPRKGIPVALALFGLVPMGVGAAYLIVYSTERRRTGEAAGPLSPAGDS
ncbi:MAG: hypothetical protein AAB225_21950 [Acidobacteriota bacterium]